MPEYTLTHQNGRTEVIDARDILDLMFSYRGNYKSIIKLEENVQIPNQQKSANTIPLDVDGNPSSTPKINPQWR